MRRRGISTALPDDKVGSQFRCTVCVCVHCEQPCAMCQVVECVPNFSEGRDQKVRLKNPSSCAVNATCSEIACFRFRRLSVSHNVLFWWAQWVKPATGWTVRGSNPGGARFSAPVQTGPGAHPASYTMCTGSFLGVKRPGRVLTTPSI